jgi:hypothetical protein
MVPNIFIVNPLSAEIGAIASWDYVGWPDEFMEDSPQNVAQPVIVKIIILT